MAGDLRARIEALLAEHHVVTLATQGRDGPWAAAVFYAAQGLNLVFLSSPRSRHALELAESPRVAATIQRDVAEWPEVRGLQIAGRVRLVADAELDGVCALYRQRYPLTGVPQAILNALDRVHWYILEPTDIHLIDNRLGFAHREHLRCGGG